MDQQQRERLINNSTNANEPSSSSTRNNSSSALLYPRADLVYHDQQQVNPSANTTSSNIAIVGTTSNNNNNNSNNQQQQQARRVQPTTKKPCSRTCGVVTCSIIALILATVGFLLIFWVPIFVNQTIEDELSLKNDRTMMYQGFRNQSHEVQIRFVYNFFNVTNWKDVEETGATPNVSVHGPYTFIRTKWRPEEEVYWDADGILHYKTLDFFTFSKELSAPGLSEDDWVITPRAALFIALQRTGGDDLFAAVLDVLMGFDNITSFFTNKTIGKLIHGYNDTFLEPFADFGISPLVSFAPDVPTIEQAKPSAIYSGRKPSSTIDDTESNRKVWEKSIGQYYQWQGNKELPWWGSKYANMINGSGGSLFPSNLFDTEEMYIFVDNLKRSLLANHHSDVDFHGINTRRYCLNADSMAAAVVNPDNEAFYIWETNLQPIPPVKNHDTRYILSVLGLPFYLQTNMTNVHVNMPRAASWELDSSHLDIEPYTGVLLRVRNQLQASVRLNPITFYLNDTTYTINATKNLPNTWLPIFTASEEYEMGESLRDKIKYEVVLTMKLAEILGPILVVISGIIVIVMIVRECICTKGQCQDAPSVKK